MQTWLFVLSLALQPLHQETGRGSTLHRDTGIASTYYVGDRLDNGRLACAHGRRWTGADEVLAAHRTLPCGTLVLVVNAKTGSAAWIPIRDRGPYGGVMPDGHWVVKRPGDRATASARYRGVIDLSIAAARLIGLPGMGRVTLYWWVPSTSKHKIRLPNI